MFILIFHVETPAWYISSLVSKRTPSESPRVRPGIPTYALSSQLTHSLLAVNTRVQIEVDSDTGLITNGRTNLFDQYLSFLLVVFIEAGFVEVSPSLPFPPLDQILTSYLGTGCGRHRVG